MHPTDCPCRTCEHVRKIVAEAPPLSDAQRDRLVAILRMYAPASQDPHPLDRLRQRSLHPAKWWDDKDDGDAVGMVDA